MTTAACAGMTLAASFAHEHPRQRLKHMIEFGHGTHVGLRREHNEDTYHADAASGLWLVADGMGGHAHGEVASAIARDTVPARISSGATLRDAIRDADRAILAVSSREDGVLPMGTTVAALQLHAGGFNIAWVGDSRVYTLQAGEFQQLSRDHSYVQELVNKGEISPAEARHHPRRNVVTQALGITPPDELLVPEITGDVVPGMQFLLCSDGLTENVDDATIAGLVARRDLAAQECVDQLIIKALECGGSDNITVLLVRTDAPYAHVA